MSISLTLLIPTAGRTRYLPALFASLALRGDEALEVLVGYHGCEATMEPWLKALPLPPDQVRTYTIPPGGGMAANWQAGLERARGRYLFIMGDDDMFAPGGVAKMLASATEGQGDILAFDRDIIDAEGQYLSVETRENEGYLNGRVYGLQKITLQNAYPRPPFMSSLYRVSWLRSLGFRLEAGGAADVDLFLRAATSSYDLERCQGRPILYRVHPSSYTSSGLLHDQALAVLQWNVAQEPGWRNNAGFRDEAAQLWRGIINIHLRSGKFSEARAALRREGHRFAWHVRLRLALKCLLRIREWRPGKFRA